MRSCEVWRNASEAEFDNAVEGMEKLVMNRLYELSVFSINAYPLCPIDSFMKALLRRKLHKPLHRVLSTQTTSNAIAYWRNGYTYLGGLKKCIWMFQLEKEAKGSSGLPSKVPCAIPSAVNKQLTAYLERYRTAQDKPL
jgi:hypothetical protein